MRVANGEYVPGYEDKGSGTPIVLLHGYCGSREYWSDAMPALSASCRVIAPDLRGHGSSPTSEEVYSMELLADDTASLLDRLGIEQAYVFGHSLGGYAALAFAEKYPERLFGFGLLFSTSLPDTEAAREGRLKAVEQLRREGVKPFVDGLIPKLFAPEHRGSMAEKVEAAKRIGYATSLQGAVGCALGMRERPDRTDVLRQTELPVLLLAGEMDEVVAAERRFPADGPNISAVTMPRAGHMGMMEDAKRFADEILAFLSLSGRDSIVRA